MTTTSKNQTAETKPKKTKGQIVRTVLSAVVIVLLAVAIVLVLMQRLRGEPTFIFGRAAVWVQTPSMEPAIPEKSYILVEPVSAENVSVGDVITFHADYLNGELNTHRVTKIVGDNAEFVTKGDNNPVEDASTAKADKIVARYVRNLPVISVFGRFFMTPAGLVCALAVIAIFMFLLYLPDILKNRKTKAEEAERRKEAEMDRKIREEVEKMKQNADSGSETGSENDPPRNE